MHFAGQTGLETDMPTLVAVVLGALTAGSALLTLTAFALPLLAFLLVLALFAGLVAA